MNNATLVSSTSNMTLLPIYYYISAFSFFFANNHLLKDDEKNQTIPVINAMFEYLHMFSNDSEGKIQLLVKVLENHIDKGKTNLDIKHIDEAFQYIINEGLFHHYGNIEYLSKIKIKGNLTFSAFREIVVQSLSDKYIRNNLCFTRNGSSDVTALAVEKLLGEYIFSVYIQERESERILNTDTKVQIPLWKRLKRQPRLHTNTDSIDVSEFIAAFKLIQNEQPNIIYNFSDSETQKLLSRLHDPNDEPDVNDDLWGGEQLDNIKILKENENISLKNSSEKQEGMRSIAQSLETSEVVGNKRQHDKTGFLPRKIQRISPGLLKTVDHQNEKPRLDDASGTSKESKASEYRRYLLPKQEERVIGTNTERVNEKIGSDLYKVEINYEGLQNPIEQAFYIEDGGQSKRMSAIEKAANVMLSCQSNYTFTYYVNLLKRYLLKIEGNTTEVPTYDQLAWEFCNSSAVLENYNEWLIPNHTFINDVLFSSNLDTISTFQELKEKLQSSRLFFGKLHVKDFETYKSSPSLRRSLRVQDYFMLIHKLKNLKTIRTMNVKKRIIVALYRLALRQCEEKWIENNITLYRFEFQQKVEDNSHSYTFKDCAEFSSDFQDVERNMSTVSSSLQRNRIFKIELENQAGIVRMDKIFKNMIGKYINLPDMTFEVISNTKEPTSSNSSIVTMKMQDRRTKEIKMIEIVNKLYEILTTSPPNIFSYYN